MFKFCWFCVVVRVICLCYIFASHHSGHNVKNEQRCGGFQQDLKNGLSHAGPIKSMSAIPNQTSLLHPPLSATFASEVCWLWSCFLSFTGSKAFRKDSLQESGVKKSLNTFWIFCNFQDKDYFSGLHIVLRFFLASSSESRDNWRLFESHGAI